MNMIFTQVWLFGTLYNSVLNVVKWYFTQDPTDIAGGLLHVQLHGLQDESKDISICQLFILLVIDCCFTWYKNIRHWIFSQISEYRRSTVLTVQMMFRLSKTEIHGLTSEPCTAFNFYIVPVAPAPKSIKNTVYYKACKSMQMTPGI